MADEETTANPIDEAKKLIAEDQQKRETACADEIKAILEKHGFVLDISKPQLILVPKG